MTSLLDYLLCAVSCSTGQLELRSNQTLNTIMNNFRENTERLERYVVVGNSRNILLLIISSRKTYPWFLEMIWQRSYSNR